jgi:1L-myo-inositol 1-phosphate cytidylyltransferase
MQKITDAVILMAGRGSRLQAPVPKPLVPISGRPLISHVIDCLLPAGIRKLHVVVGYESERLLAGLKPLIPSRLELHPIENPHWEKQNGISLLSVEGLVKAPFVLAMADHLFEASVLNILLEQAKPDSLNLAVDRKIGSIFDLDDAMKVQIKNGFVTAIGKSLTSYDAIDTGLFVCSSEIFSYLNKARKNDDCSLADGVRLMANDEKVRAIDIGDGWWQDVDTDAMFVRAEEELSARANETSFARER